MKKLNLIGAAALLLAAFAAPALAAANELITSMDTDRVDISTRFTGQELLVFGAMSRPANVVVKLTSPIETVALSRKLKLGPFWLTGGKVNVTGVPGIFGLYASAPIDNILSVAERKHYGLTLETALAGAEVKDLPSDLGDWRAAFLRLKARTGHYVTSEKAVKLTGGRLYSARVVLPASLPLGTYHLDTYLVTGHKVIAHQRSEIGVSEVKMEAWVSRVAYSRSWLFGVGFTLLAMFGGLGLGIALRNSNR